jgi:hypothetical protein
MSGQPNSPVATLLGRVDPTGSRRHCLDPIDEPRAHGLSPTAVITKNMVPRQCRGLGAVAHTKLGV